MTRVEQTGQHSGPGCASCTSHTWWECSTWIIDKQSDQSFDGRSQREIPDCQSEDTAPHGSVAPKPGQSAQAAPSSSSPGPGPGPLPLCHPPCPSHLPATPMFQTPRVRGTTRSHSQYRGLCRWNAAMGHLASRRHRQQRPTIVAPAVRWATAHAVGQRPHETQHPPS